MNRPRINEILIFGLRSHASRYTIFVGYSPLLWRTSLAPRAHTKPSEQKDYLYHLLNSPTIPSIGCSVFNVRLPARGLQQLGFNS